MRGRIRRVTVLAVVVGATTLGACAPAEAPPATVTVTATPSSSPTTPSSSTASGTPTADAAAGPCTTDDLSARLDRLDPDPRYVEQGRAAVVWTNTSPEPCTMFGFGGVDLRGPDDPTYGPSYSLPRSSDQASTRRLAPGGDARTVIMFGKGPASGPSSWTPVEIAATPPDETRSKLIPWSFGPVLRQDAATHPATFIDPVTAG